MSVAIRLERCGKTFADGTRALQPLDLSIAAGETMVLLGPSGCGKTTTLRLIAGLEAPDPGGTVIFDGRDVTRVPVEKRNVGIVFQSYALFPHLNVAANVGYGLRIRRHHPEDVRARVTEMLELVRLTELADRRIDQLSGGQKQRVALARAIAISPRVLLLDEPLAALDAKLREHLRAELRDLLRRVGITAVYVTHDQAEAMTLGDRIAVMNAGRIEQTGTPREIYRMPRTPFVAEFVGNVNRLPDGTLVRPEDILLCTNGDGELRGTVRSVAFLGDRLRLVVEGCAEDGLIVDTTERLELAAGDAVSLRVRPGARVRLES
jgi:putative spermidine/putrescine transport system ATP-binding protein